MKMKLYAGIFNLILGATLLVAPAVHADATVSGELRKWHRVTLTFNGPASSETATTNPFRDYRLNVTFTSPSGKETVVAGFYAADDDALGSDGLHNYAPHAVHYDADDAAVYTWQQGKGKNILGAI
jgi:hypothetical protein